MNSLVVFLSVVALVAGKPSGLYDSGLITYSSPIIATAPAAVSHQSRLDIKSSPAVVATETIAPISRAVIAEPVYTAAIAPSAVSSQSRIDIKSTPAITTSTLVSAPVAYSAPISYSAPIAYNAPILAGAVAPTLLKTSYAAPALIKSAEWAPAWASSAITAGPAVPLDTPEVIAARAAHLEAKALSGAHLEVKALSGDHSIHKRSASFISAPVLSTYHAATPIISSYSAPLVSTVHASPLAYSSIGYSTPLITKSYGVHAW